MNDNKLTELEYKIIDETKCGDEPLGWVLIGGYSKEYSVDGVIHAISQLLELDYLEAYKGSSDEKIHIGKGDLLDYVDRRRSAGEDLSDWPEVVQEYHFKATKKGISQLRAEDRPIPLADWARKRAKEYRSKGISVKEMQTRGEFPKTKQLTELGFSREELEQLGLS